MSFIERDPIIGVTKERFLAAGIEGVLLDLDDTIIHTSEVFTTQIVEYIDQVSLKIGVDRQKFAQELDYFNVSLHRKFGVNPKRWEGVVASLAELYPDSADEVLEGLSILNIIYTTVPRMKPGALSVLTTFKESGLKIGLVTHANVEWTNWKLDQLGLWNYFDSVIIADEDGAKSAEHWKLASDSLGVSPERCLAVGDNIQGDIQSAASLGMKTAWVPSPWAVYREGQLPEDTVKISDLGDLLTVEVW